ncbi:MAG: mono/diheme cytochrome c family protein, partial [Gammaproteobacteria bacterium]
MISRLHVLAAAGLLIAALPSSVIAQAPADETLLARGEYVFKISGCSHCHTTKNGEHLAGGRALVTPFGTFYSPNITSHKTAGIGNWSADDFQRALHQGLSPEGDDYYPAFPYTSYTGIRTDDLRALHAYILSLPASAQANREHELVWFLRWRLAAWAWKWLFFSAAEFQPHPTQSAQWNRGAYLAEAMGHCQECHTPRDRFGALRTDLAYAGNAHGPEDELVPNITSDKTTGIGDWSRSALQEFLKFGELPDGEYAAGSMDPVIEGIRYLTPEDRDALTDYLRAL